MSVYVDEYTSYYWFCDRCSESEDFDNREAANRGRDEHVCDA